MLYSILMYLLLLSIHSISSTPLLTIKESFQHPADAVIQKMLEAHGGAFTPESITHLHALVHEILQGTYTLPPCNSNQEDAQTLIQQILSSTSCTALTSTIVQKMQNYVPALSYSYFMKRLVTACYVSQQSIARQKEHIAKEDQLFSSNPILRTAHTRANEIIVTLLFIMLSPQAHPCERIHALYLINKLHLPGTHGLALQRYRDRANRFYFTYDGILREYDPTRVSAHTPKHIKAVVRFLHTISTNKAHYDRLLAMGISYGISSLEPYQENATQELWQRPVPGFMWRYAAQIFKEVTTLDVIEMRTITPEKIFSHQVNHDFMMLMLHCTPPIHHQEAQELILKHKQACPPADSMPNIMERYYQDSCQRTA